MRLADVTNAKGIPFHRSFPSPHLVHLLANPFVSRRILMRKNKTEIELYSVKKRFIEAAAYCIFYYLFRPKFGRQLGQMTYR